jgi:hypothetical protein
MIRRLLGLFLAVVLIVAAVAFFAGYRFSGPRIVPDRPDAVGTTGRPGDDRVIDPNKARARAAEVGERAASAINEAGDALSDAQLTGKIKSKMALDDSVESRHIDVDTKDHVVTLRGTVRSEAERQRALRLARETRGVTSVVDQLRIR